MTATRRYPITARAINSAYLEFTEADLGSIEVAIPADFVVNNQGFFSIPIEEVSEEDVLMTVVDAEVVFLSLNGQIGSPIQVMLQIRLFNTFVRDPVGQQNAH